MKKIRNKFLLKLLVCVLIINAFISGGEFQYFLLFAVLTTIVFNYIYLQINKKNLNHLFFSSVDYGTVGENLCVEYKLSNNSILPIMNSTVSTFISKRLGDSIHPNEELLFKSFQFINLKHEIVLKHHGYYKLGKVQVDIRDPLQLFTRRVIFDKEIDLIIYPRIFDIERFFLSHKEMFGKIDVKLKAYEDFTNIINTRYYVPGDSYKKIHWKLSAKIDKLYIKEYNLSAAGKVHIYLDCFLENYSKEDILDQDEKIVEIAGSLIKFYLKNKFEVSLIYFEHNKKKIVDGKSMRQFIIFLRALTEFEPNSNIDISQFVKNDSSKLNYGSSIIIITPKVNKQMYSVCNQQIRRKFEIGIIALEQDWISEEFFKNLKIYFKCILLDEDIKERLGEY